MIYEIKDEYIGKCPKCRKKYVCDEEDICTYELVAGYWLTCPYCGTDIAMDLKEE